MENEGNIDLVSFAYGSQEVRVFVDEALNPWWVLKDVCDVLGHTNPSVAAEGLEDDERAKKSLGRQGEGWIINESGLYMLILRSNKPEAKTFRKWVTAEVLPSLRRTGAYSVIYQDGCRPLLKMARETEGLQRLFQAFVSIARVAGFRGPQAVVRGSRAVKERTGQDCLDMVGAGFLKDTSLLDNYVAARCELHEQGKVRSAELYVDYVGWCKRAQEPPLGRNTFQSELLKQFGGIQKVLYGNERHAFFSGITLKS